jgi:hypothetical protein
MPAQPRVRFIPRREHRDPERAEIEAAAASVRQLDDDVDRPAAWREIERLMQALKAHKRPFDRPIEQFHIATLRSRSIAASLPGAHDVRGRRVCLFAPCACLRHLCAAHKCLLGHD